jgi:hypothetical protein
MWASAAAREPAIEAATSLTAAPASGVCVTIEMTEEDQASAVAANGYTLERATRGKQSA